MKWIYCLLSLSSLVSSHLLGPDDMMKLVDVEVPGIVDIDLECSIDMTYELKVSYPSVEPAKIEIVITDSKMSSRSLLNVEKEKFNCITGTYRAVITLEREGYFPSLHPRTTTLTIRLEELLFGIIPGRDTPILAMLIIVIVCLSYYVLAPLADRFLLQQ